ncbi:hypothetical protein [Treponema pectinovorum]|uniref:hypothetical protein n=1 Tax=Treponema pectinovorum TaxID=164 RepID=UPI0011F2DF05|nr:hypothetical protein [Treponema pectinovorum]
MSLTVKLPGKEQKEEYSLFVSSKITYLHKDIKYGTLIICEGCGVAFYSASNSRRAVIFSELSERNFGIPLQEGNIPYFKEPIRVLYKAKGKRIDILKFVCYNLEKKYGKAVYDLGSVYWFTLGSYIDSLTKRTLNKEKNNRQIYQLTDSYFNHKSKLEIKK